jgi:thiosulfate reductase cytochrome b subunit
VGVIVILTPLIIVSGLAMSPQLNVAFNWLPELFGGRQSARSIHFITTFIFALFTFGHILMVVVSGFVNNMRSMITGWYSQEVHVPKTAPVKIAQPPEDTGLLQYKEDDKNGET